MYSCTLLKPHLSSVERFVIGHQLFTPILKLPGLTKSCLLQSLWGRGTNQFLYKLTCGVNGYSHTFDVLINRQSLILLNWQNVLILTSASHFNNLLLIGLHLHPYHKADSIFQPLVLTSNIKHSCSTSCPNLQSDQCRFICPTS